MPWALDSFAGMRSVASAVSSMRRLTQSSIYLGSRDGRASWMGTQEGPQGFHFLGKSRRKEDFVYQPRGDCGSAGHEQLRCQQLRA